MRPCRYDRACIGVALSELISLRQNYSSFALISLSQTIIHQSSFGAVGISVCPSKGRRNDLQDDLFAGAVSERGGRDTSHDLYGLSTTYICDLSRAGWVFPLLLVAYFFLFFFFPRNKSDGVCLHESRH